MGMQVYEFDLLCLWTVSEKVPEEPDNWSWVSSTNLTRFCEEGGGGGGG